MCSTEFFSYCQYYYNPPLCKRLAVHMHALTYFIAYMQTKMVEDVQIQLGRVQLEVLKNLKSRKNVKI